MKKIIIIIFFITFNCFGKDKLPETILVGLPEYAYPPYIILEPEYSGLMLEPFLIITERMGVKVSFYTSPTIRIQKMIEKGELDAVFRSKKWISNPDDFLWTDKLMDLEDVLISDIKYSYEFKNLYELTYFVIHAHHGYGYPTLQPYFENDSMIRYDYKSEYLILKSLIDTQMTAKHGCVMNSNVAKWIIGKNKELQGRFYISKAVIDSNPYQIQLFNTSANKAYVARFNVELQKMKESGELQGIIDKYFINNYLSPD